MVFNTGLIHLDSEDSIYDIHIFKIILYHLLYCLMSWTFHDIMYNFQNIQVIKYFEKFKLKILIYYKENVHEINFIQMLTI